MIELVAPDSAPVLFCFVLCFMSYSIPADRPTPSNSKILHHHYDSSKRQRNEDHQLHAMAARPYATTAAP